MPNPALAALLAGKAPPPATNAAATPSAAESKPAVTTPPVVLPQAANRTEHLKNLIGAFASRNGTAPTVNPPEAVKALETKTAPEVAGAAEPPEDEGPEVEPPTTKPADVLAAESAPRPRRTAAVVQAELDLALGELEVVKKQLAEADPAAAKDLRAELAVAQSDNEKAWARVGELEKANGELEEQTRQAVEVIQALEQQLAAAPVAGNVDLETVHPRVLSAALAKQGFNVHLEVPAA